ncbi:MULTISPECIES: nuclear transport factor 2 family protein [Sphingobium]|uniref:nuclear transport factor 2 family protein n=1 Tax=Sphingobium sp. MI1205 TaxID=407020 RepID=UPI0007702DFF|nr:nuclear transport factor 2 family protein [Sphingobium sp. MI1205]AMK19580.1 putative aromatic ring hydroxylating dioxygenase subunit beta [Sphingobium sp. MI1205]
MSAVSLLSPAERQAIEAECNRLVVAYAVLVDRRRYDEMVALFTEDCLFERPGVEAKGSEALRAFLDSRPATIATRHLCSHPFFERVGADEATAITYVTIFHGEGSDEGPNEVPGVAGLAEFHDVFRLTPNGWRIAHRVAKPTMIVRQ